jgi:hypothetical protein
MRFFRILLVCADATTPVPQKTTGPIRRRQAPGAHVAGCEGGHEIRRIAGPESGRRFRRGLATHRSAEPETLVVRVGFDEREWMLEDAPETYYVTDYYRPYPVVLVRLRRIDRDALRDLLTVSRRLALAKTRKPRSAGSNWFD